MAPPPGAESKGQIAKNTIAGTFLAASRAANVALRELGVVLVVVVLLLLLLLLLLLVKNH